MNVYSQLTIKNLHFKNRFVMAPMCMYQANEGIANSFHFVHYVTRAIGGVAAIIVEATGVEPRGRITNNDLGLWNDQQIEPLKKIVDEVHRYDCLIGVQLAHAGRKSQTEGVILAPSSIAFEGMKEPKMMTQDDIKEIIRDFKAAAKRALLVGYDFIEVHAAHGYLINQFLSPLANVRTDIYGGSMENRTRFLQEILQEVRSVWPKEKALGIRVSAEEYDEKGNHPEDVAKMIEMIKDIGIDFVNVSSGGVIRTSIPSYPGYQLDFAKVIKEKTQLPVIGGGLIEEVTLARKAVEEQQVDLVYLGRQLLRDPYFVLHHATQMGADIPWIKSYQRAKK